MTTLLESRYRQVLRLLPAYYRRAREEEMVETYLHGVSPADQEVMRPALGEMASVAALAVRTRLGAAGSPAGYALAGGVIRYFALFAVLCQAATALTDRALALAWSRSSGPNRVALHAMFAGEGPFDAVRTAVLWALPVLWAGVYAALLHDRRRTARALAVAAAVPDAWFALHRLSQDAPFDTTQVFLLVTAGFAWLTVLAVCCGFHTDSPPTRLPLAPPGLTLMAGCVLIAGLVALWPRRLDTQWAAADAFCVAAAGWLLLRRREAESAGREGEGAAHAGASEYGVGAAYGGGAAHGGGERAAHGGGGVERAAVPVALTAVGLLLLTLRLTTLSLWRDIPGMPHGLIATAVAQSAAVAVAVTAVGSVAVRSLAAAPVTDR